MKIIETLQQDTKTTIAEQRFVGQKNKIASCKLQPGQKLWEFNLTTGAITPALYKRSSAVLAGGVKHDVDVKPGCVYIPAINEKNAFKKTAQFLKAK